MQPISAKVFIETSFNSVTLGAISTAHGLIQIDAPPSPEDARAWRASLMSIGAGAETILINLDSHPDRTLGARAMDCTILAHENTAAVFRNRPSTFKAQGDETGANWESITGLGSVRWAPPEISFTDSMALHWGENPILLQHRPGPASGAIWVVLPAEKIVFVGDLVIKGQPPFLAHGDLPNWVASLKTLLSPEFKNFTIISGRSGVVLASAAKTQLEFIQKVHERIEKLAARNAAPEATEKLVDTLLHYFKGPAASKKHFAQRLRYGLFQYYQRHYRPSSVRTEE